MSSDVDLPNGFRSGINISCEHLYFSVQQLTRFGKWCDVTLGLG